MDVIFNLFKIRFKLLEELVLAGCKELQPASKLNIFINLDCIINKLGSTNNLEKELQYMSASKKAYSFISNIINLAAHYRLFFSKNKIYSNVYIYSTYPLNSNLKNKTIYPDYRYYYISKLINRPSNYLLSEMIKSDFETAKIMMEYINGVYLIESRSVENSLIPMIITEDNRSNNINFMVTTDPYDYQYVNKGFYLLVPKKEESVLINRENLWDKLGVENIDLNPQLYSFILSVLGDKYRSLPKVKGLGLKTIVKAINKAIENKMISKDTSNISLLIPLIKDEYVNNVLTNYQCIDLDNQIQITPFSSRIAITKQIVDKFDNVGLQEITNTYFQGDPINIMEITDANKLIRSDIKIR